MGWRAILCDHSHLAAVTVWVRVNVVLEVWLAYSLYIYVQRLLTDNPQN